ncbi:hypothetical protein [Athalassotoga sp.]|uniref:hypothetical protein n=1 Tax=Athalassotoga sp. TaxID=2022597 RepID=UPI003CFFB713
MRKIPMIIAISLIALSMIVLADNTGPVFEGGQLTFNTGNQVPHLYDPNFYMVQGFLATATAYDSILPDTSSKLLLDSFYSGNCCDSAKNSVVLAGLNVESDATSVIGVSVIVSNSSKFDGEMNLSYDYPNESDGTVYSVKTKNPPATLNLPFNSDKSSHSGYLYVTSNSTTSQLSEVEKSGLFLTFVITPVNYY